MEQGFHSRRIAGGEVYEGSRGSEKKTGGVGGGKLEKEDPFLGWESRQPSRFWGKKPDKGGKKKV